MRVTASPSARVPNGRSTLLLRRALYTLGVTLGLVVCAPTSAMAQGACAAVETAWFTYVASGTPVAYGYTLDAALHTSRNGPATSVSAVGVIAFHGHSIVPLGGGFRITGLVTGVEKQNVGGTITTLVFGKGVESLSNRFTIDTNDCSGTITRLFTDGTVTDWHVVVVDGGDTIRYIDSRVNPSVRSGSMQLMK